MKLYGFKTIKDALKAKSKWADKADPIPIEVPADLKRPETQDERLRRIIREQIRPESFGYETEEDNEDLDVDDDVDFAGELPITPEEYEYIKSEHADLIDEVLKPVEEVPSTDPPPDPKPKKGDKTDEGDPPKTADSTGQPDGDN